MLDTKAFRSITYGLYLVSSHNQGKYSGCTVNTFAQVTSVPLQVSVTLNKENHTTDIIRESGRYVAVSLSENASMKLIGKFGFFSSRDTDKFEAFQAVKDEHGIQSVCEQVVARFAVKVTGEYDLGTHIIFIGTVEEAEVYSSEKPMTYDYYHQIKGGKTPERAPSFIPESKDTAKG